MSPGVGSDEEADQLLEASDNLGDLKTFERDAAGNVLTYTDADGNTVTNTYDDRGNRIRARRAAKPPHIQDADPA